MQQLPPPKVHATESKLSKNRIFESKIAKPQSQSQSWNDLWRQASHLQCPQQRSPETTKKKFKKFRRQTHAQQSNSPSTSTQQANSERQTLCPRWEDQQRHERRREWHFIDQRPSFIAIRGVN